MIYLLDTNICIYHLNGSAPKVSEKLEQLPMTSVKIPSMTAAELLYGAEKSGRRDYSLRICQTFLSLYEILPFDDRAAGIYAVLRAGFEREGQAIGGSDLVIAATALAVQGTLVTHHTKEFSRVSGLAVDDWF